MFQGIVVDSTVFNDAERLRSFLKSVLTKEYKIAIASDIYFGIKNGKWDELSELLINWEWNVKKEKLVIWHKSQEFRALCKDVIGLVVPCASVLEKLNDDERDILQRVSRIVEPNSPRMVRIAKEFVLTSVVKKFPILSYTKHAKRWFKSCKNVIIMEIADAKNSVSRAKRDIKRKVEEAGWYGYVGLFIFGLVADRALESALPPPIGALIGNAAAGSFIIGVLANGKKPTL
jgi:hypothetical protein